MFVWQHVKSVQLDLSPDWDLCKLDGCVKGLKVFCLTMGETICYDERGEWSVWLNSWLTFNGAGTWDQMEEGA